MSTALVEVKAEENVADRLGRLDEPFRDADLEWRVQSAGKKKDGAIWALVVPYVTNRAIMQRLDSTVGKENWKNEYYAGPQGGIMCGISIRIDGEWVTKFDGADNQGHNDGEAIKGGFSGSMKRAAVQWGMGRHLYELEASFANVHENGRERGIATIDGKKEYFKWDPPLLDKSGPKAAPPKAEPATTDEPGTGVVEAVEVKTGIKNGKQWKRYSVRINGVVCGTFDEGMGEFALSRKGQRVHYETQAEGKFTNLVAISPVLTDDLPEEYEKGAEIDASQIPF